MSIPKLEDIPVCDLGEFYDMLDALKDFAAYFTYKMDKVDSSNADNFAKNVNDALAAYHLLSVKGRNIMLDYSNIALAFHNEAAKCYLPGNKIKYPKKGEVLNLKQTVLAKKLAKINDEFESEYHDNLKCVIDMRKDIQYVLDDKSMNEEEHSGDGAEIFKDRDPYSESLAFNKAVNETLGISSDKPIVLD